MSKKAKIADDENVYPVEGVRKINISDLQFDDRNANQGTELGKELLQSSIAKYGVGRGVLADKNLKLIAGNHAVKEMIEQGIEQVLVIPTDGKTLVVTQRIDIEKDSKAGHELAIADNRVTQANLQFDTEVIRELDAEFDLDMQDLGIDIYEEDTSYQGYIHKVVEDENDDGEEEEEDEEEQEEKADISHETKNHLGDRAPEENTFSPSLFPLAITLTKAEKIAFDKWKKEAKVRTDTQAFCLLFKKATEA